MMKVLYSPQLNDADSLSYIFDGYAITAILNGEEDVFDFTGMTDGELDIAETVTTLKINPLISAKMVDGELSVELLNFIGTGATEEERFPTWIEV